MNRSRRVRPLRFAPLVVPILLTGISCASSPDLAPCPAPSIERYRMPEGADLPMGNATAGAEIFEAECAKCHEPQLAARSRLRHSYPRLDCSQYLGSVSDAYLAHVIGQGGEAVGLDAVMQAFGNRLSAAQMADLIAFIRQTERRE